MNDFIDNLKLLKGRHKLTAVDTGSKNLNEEYGSDFDADVDYIAFTLDNKTYFIIENPDDGYRSYAKDEILVKDGSILDNSFYPVDVVCKISSVNIDKDNSIDENSEVIQIIDIENGEIILYAGTENTSDYYPYFVSAWMPEKMAINKKGKIK